MPIGSGRSVIVVVTGSPDPRQRPFRPSISSYPASYPETVGGGADHVVPVSCCLSATGVRFSIILFPPRDWAFLTVGLPAPGGRTQTGLPRSARTSYDRGGSPLYPEDDGARPDLGDVPSRRLPLHGGSSFNPAPASHLAGVCLTRHQRGFKQFSRPVFPSPVAARMEREPLGFPSSFAPRRYRQRTSRVGTGHRARARNYQLNITLGLILRPVVHSFRATSRRTVHCDSLDQRDTQRRTRSKPSVGRCGSPFAPSRAVLRSACRSAALATMSTKGEP